MARGELLGELANAEGERAKAASGGEADARGSNDEIAWDGVEQREVG